jgi:hypothetical protein
MRVCSLKEEVVKYGEVVCSIRSMKGGKTMIEDLKHKFDTLADEEKIEFMKLIMPSFREIFRKNPEKMMAEMMPFCRDMMKSCGMDMQGMMKVMGMMGKQKT